MEKKYFYTLPELAKIMGISRVAVFKKVKRGEIKASRAGKNYIVSAEEYMVNEEEAKYGEVYLYREGGGVNGLKVRLVKDTVWLNLNQMAGLFKRDKSVISRHIDNVFREGELSRGSTVAKFATVQKEGGRPVNRDVDYFNLDVIISVGYRVKSKNGVRFRVWATGILSEYLKKGYVLNVKLLEEKAKAFDNLKSAIGLIGKAVQKGLKSGEENELLGIIMEYASSLELLQGYDDMDIKNTCCVKPGYVLTYEDASAVVTQAKATLAKDGKASGLFGMEIGHKLKSLIGAMNQTFDGHALYKTVEEKAAHLLYFAVKDHPFCDGNKRLAAILFLRYMSKNGVLHDKAGRKKISDGALAALTLLIAVSNPKEKKIMVDVAVNIITG